MLKKLQSAYEAHLEYSENENQLINLYLNLAYGATKMTWSYEDVRVEFDKEKGIYKSEVKVTFHLSEHAYTEKELTEKGISERNYFIYVPLGEMPAKWQTEEDIDRKYLTFIADKEIKRYFEEKFYCSYFLEKLLPKEEKTYSEKLRRYNEIERLADNQEHDRRTLQAPKNAIELWTFNEYTYQELPF